jgi:hypothetical protein
MPKFRAIKGPVILAGQSLSNMVDCTAGVITNILMPTDWDYSGGISFDVSPDGVAFWPAVHSDGTEIVTPITPGTAIVLPSEMLRPCGFIRFRSGTRDRPVIQKRDRTFQVVLYVSTDSGSGGAKPETGYLGTKLDWADGSGIQALPNWLPAPFIDVKGPHGVLEGGGFRCSKGGPCVLSMHGFVQHQWDRWVMFGRRWNGGEIMEFGRIQIKSNDPVLIYFETDVTLVQDGLLETFISSDFQWASFAWSNGQMMFLVEASDVVADP